MGVGVLAEVVDGDGGADEGVAALEGAGLEGDLKQGQGHGCSVHRGWSEVPVWW